MLEMADQEQGVPAPYPPPAPVQAGQQAQHKQQQQDHVALKYRPLLLNNNESK